MVSTSQNSNSLHKILTSKLTLTIPPSKSSSSSPPTEDFDFSDVFGPTPSSPSSQNPYPKDPQVIHNRSHSFLGPSPRCNIPSTHPFHQTSEEIISQISDDEDDDDVEIEVKKDGTFVEQLVCIEEEKEDDDDEDEDENKMISKVGPEDFEILRVIGKGAFGKVFQVKRKGDCENDGDGILAMKVMRKDNIIKKNHVDYMKAERDILTKVVHPFIVQLRYSFQTKSKLYLILDFINGGHLFFHLYRQKIFSEDQARLYTAEIVSAVSHLHKNGIVHRDLKPENILMDADGHVVLTDFGLAKEIDESSRSNSLCGTMEYMAPEIIQAKGHNKNADWWSVGILLYEMLNGQPPFTHSNRQKLQQKIINEKVKLPPMVTTEAHSLLKGLLHKDPSKRLGSGPTGADEIKSHKWFRPINWKKLEAREIQPKFKPDVSGKECTANFDKCWTTMPANDSPAPTPTGNEHFQGYTYVAPNHWLSSDGDEFDIS
ncbi:serine/threonine-protein kinase AtPK2/AtPK19-like isoform X1 [Amaranthus tricolor]|uniref:serine/threonine-protein kinase AtPK2/AtPK19-like isoform X1 n=1 Tax=Amaranthus tricolor TaxID=29722 RepID=UPI00258CB294|nr:serine/threonine-protein kinase AtPK2/AtPK19-like isoform X1 [Amaranthus tricolor]